MLKSCKMLWEPANQHCIQMTSAFFNAANSDLLHMMFIPTNNGDKHKNGIIHIFDNAHVFYVFLHTAA